MLRRLLPLLLTLAAAPLHAADTDAERASRLRDEAEAMRAKAESDFAATEAECHHRFLVNRCIDEAKEERVKRIRASRALDGEARALERAAKQRAVAERDAEAKHAADEPATPLPVQATQRPDETEAARAAREAEAKRNANATRARRAQQDAEKAAARAKAEAEAARRAEQAARDRERYDARQRERQQAN